MTKILFSTGWTVAHLGEESQARPVTLPHDAMLAEPRSADSAGGTNTGWFAGRDYVYEKSFPAPAELLDAYTDALCRFWSLRVSTTTPRCG